MGKAHVCCMLVLVQGAMALDQQPTGAVSTIDNLVEGFGKDLARQIRKEGRILFEYASGKGSTLVWKKVDGTALANGEERELRRITVRYDLPCRYAAELRSDRARPNIPIFLKRCSEQFSYLVDKAAPLFGTALRGAEISFRLRAYHALEGGILFPMLLLPQGKFASSVDSEFSKDKGAIKICQEERKRLNNLCERIHNFSTWLEPLCCWDGDMPTYEKGRGARERLFRDVLQAAYFLWNWKSKEGELTACAIEEALERARNIIRNAQQVAETVKREKEEEEAARLRRYGVEATKEVKERTLKPQASAGSPVDARKVFKLGSPHLRRAQSCFEVMHGAWARFLNSRKGGQIC